MSDVDHAQKQSKNTSMAALSYLIFFLPFFSEDKNDAFVKYHVKQGIVLFFTWIIVWIFSFLPLIGWLLAGPLYLICLLLLLIGIINALTGKKKPLPFVGRYVKSFHI